MPHADRRIRRSLGLLAVLGLSAAPLACGLDTYGSKPVNPGGGVAGSGGTAGAGGMGGAGASGGTGGAGGDGGGSEPCTPGEMRMCYSGPAGTPGVGDCKTGTQYCGDDGLFGPCEDEVVPAAAEDCTLPGDEDCNGEAQEAAICICEPLQPASCNTGLQGICAEGMGTCSADGKTVEACTEAHEPAFDNCTTAADEDCDGTAINTCTGAVETGFTHAGNTTGSMDDVIYDVAITPDGGYVIAGVVKTSLGGDFFGLTGGSAYVAKVGADGEFKWQKDFPADVAVARGVAVNATGQITIAGEFIGTVNFGGSNLSTPGGSTTTDIFLATFDPTGAHVWSKRFGGNYPQTAQDVDVDADGNLYITGWLDYGQVNLGGGNLDPNAEDIFVASYNSAGNHRWSKVLVNGNDQRGRRVAVLSNGNVAVLGEVSNSVNLGGGNLTGGGGRDIGVGVYAGANGNHVWSKLFGSAEDQWFGNIAAAPNGNVLLTGRFTGSLDFGGGAMMAVGAADLYVAEITGANGSHVRNARFGTSGTTRGTAIAADGAGNVVVVGYHDGTVDLGGGAATSSGWDVFVAKFSAANWSHLWTKRLGSMGNQFAWGLAIDGKGDAVVGGGFFTELAVGAPVGTISSTGGADLFGVRLSP